ncbi:cytochrome P450 [Sodiomyces alkalinus F11]|uniref:Cytochrome P450 n=1 Tax=Sodiomyces alkalinus (strain CBS 110278 / VKM F-3762 / F11) TaxID=1314773 RepID=A0A3N2PWY6_SODAK|nr:cytochrome P450 [Sodiomyces alkalinus F11]ROT39031.1 cytochrome P450 [Sodiomyces alkalinus F11]
MANYPPDVTGQFTPFALFRAYPHLASAGAFYMDVWPLNAPLLVVFDPAMMAQFSQDTPRPKHDLVKREFRPFSQNLDLVTSEGQTWRTWRAAFNPGFSAQNIMAHIPVFMEEVLVFKAYLGRVAATGETIRMESQLMKATCDIICRAVLGVRMHIQTKPSPLYDSLKSCIALLIGDSSPRMWPRIFNPLRPFLIWNHNRIMRRELLPLLEAQLKEHDESEVHGGTSTSSSTTGLKTIANLSIRAYRNERVNLDKGNKEKAAREFLEVAVEHLKMFLFAGHDTTASVLSYAYYFLHRNPSHLAKVRAEHDAVFGPDPSRAAAQLAAKPTLLNQLPYTTAVLKEVLRLSPPVGSVREGGPDFFLTHPESGTRFPTDGVILFACSFLSHRHPGIWAEPDKFVPERWLTPDPEQREKEARLRKNAWRPFELGPRACIGQELALTELRLLLVLTVREFDVVPDFPEDAPTVFGEVGYQADLPGELTAHMKGGFPAKIVRRQHVASTA